MTPPKDHDPNHPPHLGYVTPPETAQESVTEHDCDAANCTIDPNNVARVDLDFDHDGHTHRVTKGQKVADVIDHDHKEEAKP